jgi:hypothetical protein
MPPGADIRNVLFGDLPFSEWPNQSTIATIEPWRSFQEAGKHIADGNAEQAKQKLHEILAMANLEARHYLQAWHFLRGVGEQPPPDQAKRIYGVVVEVGLDDGLDVVAAYSDLTARYLNYSGAAIIWERADDSLDHSINALLRAGAVVAQKIGPWEKVRPPAPQPGQVRINLLVPSGLHFGQGPLAAISADPLGGPVIDAAMKLLHGLIAKTQSGHS